MSTGLELIPLALAAAGAARLVRKHTQRPGAAQAVAGIGVPIVTFPTRWRDEDLLVTGLTHLGAAPEQRDGAWAGTVDGVGLVLTRGDDGGYDAHFHDRTPVEQAQEVLDRLDRTYCADLQRRLRERVLTEAPGRGMTPVEEYQEDDGTVVITLELGDPR